MLEFEFFFSIKVDFVVSIIIMITITVRFVWKVVDHIL